MIDIEHRDYSATFLACEAVGGVDLIVTSPPYPNARPGQYGGDAPHDWTWPDYQKLGDAALRACKPGGFCVVNIDGPVRKWRGAKIGSERSLVAFKLAVDWAERVGFRYVEHCAFVREGMPGWFGDRWRSGWEPVHVFQRPGAKGYFDRNGVKIPAISGNKTITTGGARGNRGRAWVRQYEQGPERLVSTALKGCANTASDHPAPFPLWLADAFILCYSSAGATVCDPFIGGGTVAVSSVRANRSFIGGDLGVREEDGRRWADLSRERALAVTPEQDR